MLKKQLIQLGIIMSFILVGYLKKTLEFHQIRLKNKLDKFMNMIEYINNK